MINRKLIHHHGRIRILADRRVLMRVRLVTLLLVPDVVSWMLVWLLRLCRVIRLIEVSETFGRRIPRFLMGRRVARPDGLATAFVGASAADDDQGDEEGNQPNDGNAADHAADYRTNGSGAAAALWWIR